VSGGWRFWNQKLSRFEGFCANNEFYGPSRQIFGSVRRWIQSDLLRAFIAAQRVKFIFYNPAIKSCEDLMDLWTLSLPLYCTFIRPFEMQNRENFVDDAERLGSRLLDISTSSTFRR
jgi:hypothetical protein